MNSVIFMPHCGGGGDVELSTVLLTFAIVGVILIILGILINILHIKFSQGFGASIRWADIKPGTDDITLGGFCGFLGSMAIASAALVGLGAGVYWCIITL
jgi:hypothetical protein